MKYGKEFQQILNDPAIPPEWRSSAIEYGRLKKLIKDVVAELGGMGLSPHVLHKLLSTEEEPDVTDQDEGGEVLEFEFESPDNSPPSGDIKRGSTPINTKEAQQVVVDPVPVETVGTSSNRTFRLRLVSDAKAEKERIRPMGVMDMVRVRTEGPKKKSKKIEERGRVASKGRHVRRAVVDEHGAVKAEYVLVGDSDHPTPQLRLHVSATPSPDRKDSSGISSSASNTTDSEVDLFTSESEDEPEKEELITRLSTSTSTSPYKSRLSSPLNTPRPFYRSPRMISQTPSIDVIPPSPTLQRLRQAVSPIWALASGHNIQDGLRDLQLDQMESRPVGKVEPLTDMEKSHISSFTSTSQSSAPNDKPTAGSRPVSNLSTSPQSSERDFIIPLASDVAFFNLLTDALTQLSTFHSTQQEIFRTNVSSLCENIRTSISPNTTLTLTTPSPTDNPIGPRTRESKKDLYAWREIFGLWIEFEIFESSAERTRGERTVEQAQARLQLFANEVVKRGLGDRRTLRGKKSRGAWEEFLRLNVLLLDLKRFQLANINAARKILKKHDKRTALTASAGFPSFVRSTLVNSVDKDGNVSTWNFYNTSLPHVLLASLTDTLLPILPSLDDYACLICTSIAFKPIRLSCRHLFCVRCLVKMQRAGKAECPLCRSKVVLHANKDSLDMTLMRFMKDWFPREVKEKQRENEREIAHEHAGAVIGYQGPPPTGDDARCIIM